jgi:hypothetical protein
MTKKKADKEILEIRNLKALGVTRWDVELYDLATKRLATISALKDYAKHLNRTKTTITGNQLLIVIGLSLGENDNIEDFK